MLRRSQGVSTLGPRMPIGRSAYFVRAQVPSADDRGLSGAGGLVHGGFVAFELRVVAFDLRAVALVRHAAPLQRRPLGVSLPFPKIDGFLVAIRCVIVFFGSTIVAF